MYAVIIAASTRPGMVIASSSLLTDTWPMAPMKTASALGGMRMASVPVAMMGPTLISGL